MQKLREKTFDKTIPMASRVQLGVFPWKGPKRSSQSCNEN